MKVYEHENLAYELKLRNKNFQIYGILILKSQPHNNNIIIMSCDLIFYH